MRKPRMGGWLFFWSPACGFKMALRLPYRLFARIQTRVRAWSGTALVEVIMALSIKNEQAERLARTIASVTGETMTRAIITSLELRLEKLQGRRTSPDLFEELLRISHRCQELPDIDPRDPDEILEYSLRGTFD